MTESAKPSDTAQIQLKKGALQLSVMAILARKESYAYEISSTLSDTIGIGESTIYPLMRRMQKEGLVVSYLVETSSGPSRKYYRLTEAGWRVFEKQKSDWRTFTSAINTILGDSA